MITRKGDEITSPFSVYSAIVAESVVKCNRFFKKIPNKPHFSLKNRKMSQFLEIFNRKTLLFFHILYFDNVYLSRGIFHSHRKKTKLADLDFKKAIELNPENEEFIELIKNSDKLIAHSDKLLNEIKIVNIIFWGIIIYFGYQVLSIGFSIIGEIFKTIF